MPTSLAYPGHASPCPLHHHHPTHHPRHHYSQTIKHSSAKSKSYSVHLSHGRGHLCLSTPGDYVLKVDSCGRTFELPEYSVSTLDASLVNDPLVIRATKHKVVGEIFTKQADSIVVNIRLGSINLFTRAGFFFRFLIVKLVDFTLHPFQYPITSDTLSTFAYISIVSC